MQKYSEELCFLLLYKNNYISSINPAPLQSLEHLLKVKPPNTQLVVVVQMLVTCKWQIRDGQKDR